MNWFNNLLVTILNNLLPAPADQVKPNLDDVVIPDANTPMPISSGFSEKFIKCYKETLIFERGKDDNPHDPGGRTFDGIIQTEYNSWRRKNGLSVQDVWKMTNDEKKQIYFENYWVPLCCEQLPIGTAFALYDYGVNSGNSRSIRYAQIVLGLAADGKLGPKTLDALKSADPVDFINRLDTKRLSFLQGLTIWKWFGRGWTSRVSQGRAFALQLAKGIK